MMISEKASSSYLNVHKQGLDILRSRHINWVVAGEENTAMDWVCQFRLTCVQGLRV